MVSFNRAADRRDPLASPSGRSSDLVVTAWGPDGGDSYAHLALLEFTPGTASFRLASTPNGTHLADVPQNTEDGNAATWWQPVAGSTTPTLVVDRGPGAAAFSSVRSQWYAVALQAIASAL